MSKGLEALKEYRNHQLGVNVYADELLDIAEKELKALEIIKEKDVDPMDIRLRFHCGSVEVYNRKEHNHIPLTQEEYDLLKEVLK